MKYIHQLKMIDHYDSKVKSFANNWKGNPEYEESVKYLKGHNQSANWMKGFLIDLVNSQQIANLVLYYESLIEDGEVGPDQLPFIREFKEKYKDDLSFFYDFLLEYLILIHFWV